MVPLATPARLATSSSRVAAKPRAMNSSSAASVMAARRSAVRSARLAGGFGSFGAAAPPATRRLPGFGTSVSGRVLVMIYI